MRMVLADLALESEAMTALSLQAARSFDLAAGRRPGGRVRPARHAGRQVRHLQGGAAPHLRGDGVPRRQRLCGGKRPAPALPGGAGQRDLGGLGQRDRPRHPARRDPRAGGGDLGAGAPHGRTSGTCPAPPMRPGTSCWRSIPRTPRRGPASSRRGCSSWPPPPLSSAPPRPRIAEAYALTRLAAPSRMIGANDLGEAVNPLLERAFVAI